MLKKVVLKIIKLLRGFFYNTPIHRLKIVNQIYEKLFHLVFPSGSYETINYFGVKITLSTSDISILPSMLNGEYEKKQLEVFEVLINRLNPKTFIDVGANVGLYSLIAKKNDKNIDVYAFEPEENNVNLLNKNIQQNKADDIKIIKKGVSDSSGKKRLYLSESSTGTHSLIKTKSKFIDIETTTLDKYFKNNIKKPYIIKIDVEGHEPEALKGGIKTVKNSDALFIEYNAGDVKNFSFSIFSSYIKHHKYIYLIDDKKNTIKSVTLKDLKNLVYANLLLTKRDLQNIL